MKKSLGAQAFVVPTPTWIVGTYDEDGQPNLMAVAWGGICCSDPPCIAIALRKATYTYGSLVARKAFTINVPSENHVKEADYFGLVSGRDTQKFSVTGLTPVGSELVDAPYVEEFPVALECNVVKVSELGLHTQFVGQIMDVKADEDVLGVDDQTQIMIEKVRPIIFSPGNRAYYGVGSSLGQAFAVGKEIGAKGQTRQ